MRQNQNRLKVINARLTEEEYEALSAEVDCAALSLSEYIRRRIFGKRKASKSDLRVLAELRRLGGLLKLVHNESRGAYRQETEAVINAIKSYVESLEMKLANDS